MPAGSLTLAWKQQKLSSNHSKDINELTSLHWWSRDSFTDCGIMKSVLPHNIRISEFVWDWMASRRNLISGNEETLEMSLALICG